MLIHQDLHLQIYLQKHSNDKYLHRKRLIVWSIYLVDSRILIGVFLDTRCQTPAILIEILTILVPVAINSTIFLLLMVQLLPLTLLIKTRRVSLTPWVHQIWKLFTCFTHGTSTAYSSPAGFIAQALPYFFNYFSGQRIFWRDKESLSLKRFGRK